MAAPYPSQVGPGLWIRTIRSRFGARRTEWQLATITLLWGVVLLLPSEIFSGPSFSGLRALFGSEVNLGWAMIILGWARLIGLIINGSMQRVTPWVRVVSAIGGFAIWIGLTTGFALSGVLSTWLAVYPVFAATEIANVITAARDTEIKTHDSA